MEWRSRQLLLFSYQASSSLSSGLKGGFSLARTPSVVRLGRAILEDARDAGAQAVVVGCPMCHSNLDFRQRAIARRSAKPLHMPILFLPQLVGMSLGVEPKRLGLDRHFVSPVAFLDAVAAQQAAPEQRETA